MRPLSCNSRIRPGVPVVFVFGEVLPDIRVGQVLDEFHPVPPTTEVNEADFVGEGPVKRIR